MLNLLIENFGSVIGAVGAVFTLGGMYAGYLQLRADVADHQRKDARHGGDAGLVEEKGASFDCRIAADLESSSRPVPYTM